MALTRQTKDSVSLSSCLLPSLPQHRTYRMQRPEWGHLIISFSSQNQNALGIYSVRERWGGGIRPSKWDLAAGGSSKYELEKPSIIFFLFHPPGLVIAPNKLHQQPSVSHFHMEIRYKESPWLVGAQTSDFAVKASLLSPLFLSPAAPRYNKVGRVWAWSQTDQLSVL